MRYRFRIFRIRGSQPTELMKGGRATRLLEKWNRALKMQ